MRRVLLIFGVLMCLPALIYWATVARHLANGSLTWQMFQQEQLFWGEAFGGDTVMATIGIVLLLIAWLLPRKKQHDKIGVSA